MALNFEMAYVEREFEVFHALEIPHITTSSGAPKDFICKISRFTDIRYVQTYQHAIVGIGVDMLSIGVGFLHDLGSCYVWTSCRSNWVLPG